MMANQYVDNDPFGFKTDAKLKIAIFAVVLFEFEWGEFKIGDICKAG